jgi:hypothetical protein
VAGAFWEAFEQAGGELKAHEQYDHDTTTFSGPLRKLVERDTSEVDPEVKARLRKAMAEEKNPYQRRKLVESLMGAAKPVIDFEALLVPDYYKAVGMIAPALAVEDIITNGCDEKAMEAIEKTQRRKPKTVLLLGTNGWNSPDLVTRGGHYVQCSVFVDGFFAGSARPQTRRFVEAFSAAYAPRKPGLFEAQGFDAVGLAREVLTTARPQSREAFRSGLAGLKRFPGVMGDTSFGADREADRPLFFVTVERAGFKELDVKISGAAKAGP